MLVPAVMFIEAAASDILSAHPSIPDWMKKDQMSELNSFGETRAQSLGASGLSDDFKKGYELGIATARVVIAGNPKLMFAGIKPGEVL